MARFCVVREARDNYKERVMPYGYAYSQWQYQSVHDCHVYSNIEEAKRYAKNLSQTYLQDTFTVKVWVDGTWYTREANRFDAGEYILPAWKDEPWWQGSKYLRLHFAHIAEKEPENIAFTESPEKGMDNIKKSIKPGKYLERYFSDVLTKSQIQQWAEKHKGIVVTKKPSRIKWARTPEEMAAVYQMSAGFSSCMQHSKDRLSRNIPVHPASAYGAGDFELAYITHETDDQRLVARALVLRSESMKELANKNKNWLRQTSSDGIRVGRVYGDEYLMQRELRKEGIETTATNSYFDCMAGAKMLMIPWKSGSAGTFVMPYIDSAASIKVDGDYFITMEDGARGSETTSRNTDGTLGRCFKSDKSGKIIFNGYSYNVVVSLNEDGTLIEQIWADSELSGVFSCYRTNKYYVNGNFKKIEIYSPDHMSRYDYVIADIPANQLGKDYFLCSKTNKHFFKQHVVEMADGTYWNITSFREQGFMSSYNKKRYPNTDKAIIGGYFFTTAQAKRLFYWDRDTQKWTTRKKVTAKDDLFRDLIGGDASIADEIINNNRGKPIKNFEYVTVRGYEYENKKYTYNEAVDLNRNHRARCGQPLNFKVENYTDMYVIIPDGHTYNSYNSRNPLWPTR